MSSKTPDTDNVEKIALVKGRTIRGYTIACNSIKNQKSWIKDTSLDDSIDKYKDSSHPLFLKNIFRSFFLFIPYNLDEEIQSEVFYIGQENKTVRVCPSNKVLLSGL
jgi:hypothetical protein